MEKVCGYCGTKKPLGEFFAPPNDGRANSVGSSANLIYQKVFHSRIA